MVVAHRVSCLLLVSLRLSSRLSHNTVVSDGQLTKQESLANANVKRATAVHV